MFHFYTTINLITIVTHSILSYRHDKIIHTHTFLFDIREAGVGDHLLYFAARQAGGVGRPEAARYHLTRGDAQHDAHADADGPRAFGVEVYQEESPARLQDPKRFSYHSGGVFGFVQKLLAGDDVERCVGRGEFVRGALQGVDGDARARGLLAGDGEHGRGGILRGESCGWDVLCELHDEESGAGGEVEDAKVGGGWRLG